MSTYPIIHPLNGDFPARDENGNCMCPFCRHWHPLIKTLEEKLVNDAEGLKLLEELSNEWINESEMRDYAEVRLNGSWPGWEDLKDYSPRTHRVVKKTDEEIAAWDKENGNEE